MTVVGDDKALLGPVEYAWIAKKSGVYPYGITGTIANGADAGMARATGFTELAESIPAGSQTNAIGDNRVIGGFRQGQTELPTATLGFIVFDHTIVAALASSTIYTDGAYDISWRSQSCLTIANCVLVVNGRMKSQDSGAVNLPGWWTKIYPDVELIQEGSTYSGTSAESVLTNFAVTMNEVDTTPWGELITTNYDQTYGYSTRPIIADNPITMHTYIGDGTNTTFVLDETPSAEDVAAVPIWEDGVKLTYTTDYTAAIATKTVTYEAGSIPAAAAVDVTAYQFTAGC